MQKDGRVERLVLFVYTKSTVVFCALSGFETLGFGTRAVGVTYL